MIYAGTNECGGQAGIQTQTQTQRMQHKSDLYDGVSAPWLFTLDLFVQLHA